MAKKRDLLFYSETVAITIFSLLAASLWIEVVKGSIQKYWEGDVSVLIGFAIIATVLAVILLKYVFCDLASPTLEKTNDSDPQTTKKDD